MAQDSHAEDVAYWRGRFNAEAKPQVTKGENFVRLPDGIIPGAPAFVYYLIYFWVVVIVIFIVFRIIKSARGKAKLSGLKDSPALDFTNKTRLAVYVELSAIDGRTLEDYPQVLGKKKGGVMNPVMVIIPAGHHELLLGSNNTGDGDVISGDFAPGTTYQVGANDAGFYVVRDDDEFTYVRALPNKKIVRAGAAFN